MIKTVPDFLAVALPLELMETTDLLEEAGITYFVDYQPTIKNIPIENLLRTCTPSIAIKDRYTAKSIVGKFLSEINL